MKQKAIITLFSAVFCILSACSSSPSSEQITATESLSPAPIQDSIAATPAAPKKKALIFRLQNQLHELFQVRYSYANENEAAESLNAKREKILRTIEMATDSALQKEFPEGGTLRNICRNLGFFAIDSLLAARSVPVLVPDETHPALRIPYPPVESQVVALALGPDKSVPHSRFLAPDQFNFTIRNRRAPAGHRFFYLNPEAFSDYSTAVDSLLLVPIGSDGFETNSYVLTVWRPVEDSLELVTILDRSIRVSIGGMAIDSIMTLNEQQKLLISQSGGGDGEEIWGAFFVSVWEYPRSLRIVDFEWWSGGVLGEDKEEWVSMSSAERTDSIIYAEKSSSFEWQWEKGQLSYQATEHFQFCWGEGGTDNCRFMEKAERPGKRHILTRSDLSQMDRGKDFD